MNFVTNFDLLSIWFWSLFEKLAMQGLDPMRFQSLTQSLEFQYQALAHGVAQHAEQRRVEIEKEKLERAASAASS